MLLSASKKFHDAIRNDAQQIPLFIFEDCVISSSDIVLNSGFRFSENVISDEDFCPGQCCSSTLDFQVANENSDWNDFNYGEFMALLGVKTNEVKGDSTECFILPENNRITASKEVPYLTFNGKAINEATEPIYSVALFNERLFAFTNENVLSFLYTDSGITKSEFNVYLPPILRNSERWKRRSLGICYGHSTPNLTTGINSENNLTICEKGRISVYEMLPLGVFNAERPTFSSKKIVDVNCFDRMTKFDTECDVEKLEFPTTLYGLLRQCCEQVGVPLKNVEISNGEAIIDKCPDLDGRTWRDVVGFIAELSGDFARINRYGELELKWLTEVGISLDGHDYTEYDAAFYSAAPVDNVVFRDSAESDIVVGGNGNTLYIQNNPIARIVMEEWSG